LVSRPDLFPVRGASSAHRLVAPWSVPETLGTVPVQPSSWRRGRSAPRAGFRGLPGACLAEDTRAGAGPNPTSRRNRFMAPSGARAPRTIMEIITLTKQGSSNSQVVPGRDGAPGDMLTVSRSSLVEGMVTEFLDFFGEPRLGGSTLS